MEKKSLKSFADVIAGALDKSYAYRELTTVNKNLTDVNKEIELAHEKLKTVDETKSSILSFAQHYLQNPIENIVMASSMLADGSFGENLEDLKKVSAKLFESARHLSLTVKMWLKALDFEENRVKYQKEKFDLANLIDNILKDWELIAQNRGVTLSFKKSGHPPFSVNADKAWIHDVVINLIDNAFKMTEKGSIEVKLEKVGIEKIRLSITDSGVGIDEQTAAVLFQKFERGHAGWKKDVEGTGLGLYISKKIIEEGHGGRIWAESEGAGRGATFYIELNAV
jgi:signal transduction histidine kinase